MGHLSIQDLVVEYPSGGYAVRPINGLSLDIPAGSLVILLGPSGCGKTTLLSCLAGIFRPKSGAIKFDNVLAGPQIVPTGGASSPSSGAGSAPAGPPSPDRLNRQLLY